MKRSLPLWEGIFLPEMFRLILRWAFSEFLFISSAKITDVLKTAGEGGPYGMALLASYLLHKEAGETLEHYLSEKVFVDAASTTIEPDAETVEGFNRYVESFKALLEVERKAVEVM